MERTGERPVRFKQWASASARDVIAANSPSEDTRHYLSAVPERFGDQNLAIAKQLIQERDFNFFYLVPKGTVVYAQNTDRSPPLTLRKAILVAKGSNPGRKKMIEVTNLLPWAEILYNDGQLQNLAAQASLWVSRRKIVQMQD